jgi:hypothetical protein
MGEVTGRDLLREAVAELYTSAPHEFISRRGALAAGARAAGEPAAAKEIAALRKPTQSAWIVNQLVRSAPAAVEQLAELGAELRAAQRGLDGTAIRELSLRRRELIDSLVRQAFTVAGQQAPPAALRDEVATTLAAAMADPQVGEQLQAGAMERGARSDGFGSAAPVLTLVSSPPTAAPSGRSAAPGRAAPKATAAAAEKARRERRREAVAAGEEAVTEADRAADAATKAEQDLEAAVEMLEEKLADARQQLAEARLQARGARSRSRQALQALQRIQA